MEDPVLTLDVTRLRAEPGGQAQLSVKVKNPGHLVESFRLDVVGLDRSWWQVHPPELPVYPGKEESALVVLSPPATAEAPEQALPFGVRAISSLDEQRSVVEEGDLEVGRVLDLQAAIAPVSSRGRWFGRHRVTYTNWGNSPVHLRLSAVDKDEQLGFQLVPDQLTVPVGGRAGARLRVRPRNPFLRGAQVHRPFQVVGESAGSAPPPGTPRSPAARAGVPDPGRPVLDGAMVQLPILNRSVVMLAGLLVAAVVALFVLGARTGSVPGATQADVAPEAPTQVSVQPVTAQQIQLRWAAVERATGYSVQEVDAGGQVEKVLPVQGGATALSVPTEQPLTQLCFTVIAVRGKLTGPPSARQCGTSGSGELDPPQDVKAVPADGGGYQVSWTDDQRNGHIVVLDGQPAGQPSPPGIQAATVAAPAGKHCLQVIAQRGANQTSRPSDQVCAISTGSGPSVSATAGGAGAGGGGGGAGPTGSAGSGAAGVSGFVAVVGPPFAEQPLADTLRQQLTGQGVQAQVVPLPQLPQAHLGTNGFIVVATGFGSADAAQKFCDTPHQVSYQGCQVVNTAGG